MKSWLQDNDTEGNIHTEGNLLFLKDLLRTRYKHTIFAII